MSNGSRSRHRSSRRGDVFRAKHGSLSFRAADAAVPETGTSRDDECDEEVINDLTVHQELQPWDDYEDSDHYEDEGKALAATTFTERVNAATDWLDARGTSLSPSGLETDASISHVSPSPPASARLQLPALGDVLELPPFDWRLASFNIVAIIIAVIIRVAGRGLRS